MSRLWKWYQNSLSHHPLKTQMVSSGLIWGIAQIAQQPITHSTAKGQHQIQAQGKDEEFKHFCWKNVGLGCLYGFAFVGPTGHIWYPALDRYTKTRLKLKPNSFRFVASKVVIDEFFFAPFVFFLIIGLGFAAGKSVPEIKAEVKRAFTPSVFQLRWK